MYHMLESAMVRILTMAMIGAAEVSSFINHFTKQTHHHYYHDNIQYITARTMKLTLTHDAI